MHQAIDPNDVENHDPDVPWLRDQVDDAEILPLFADEPEIIRRAVCCLIAEASVDDGLEARLVEALEMTVEERSDESQAGLWLTVILGEICSERAIGVLLRSLGSNADEVLQDAAGVALLRIGSPALLMLMERVEEEDVGVDFNRAAFRLLGELGVLEDDILLRRVGEFLEDRLPAERRKERAESALEELIAASARLGLRGQLDTIKEVFKKDFRESNPVVQDAIEMLEENEAAAPIVPTITPWEERYGWLFEDGVEEARVYRSSSADGGTPAAFREGAGDVVDEELDEDDPELANEGALSYLYWGLNATAQGPGKRRLDARRFLASPLEGNPKSQILGGDAENDGDL